MAKTFLRFLITFLFSLTAITGMAADKLDRPSIDKIITAVHKAAERKDARGVAQYLAEDVKISLTIGPQKIPKMTKAQFLRMTEQGWAVTQNYKYDLKIESVVFSKDKKQAEVTSRVKETFTMQGLPMAASTYEETTFELINGALLITKIFAISSVTN